jgi:hypothetical protein
MITHGHCATMHWFRPEAAEVFESQRTARPLPGHCVGTALGGPYRPPGAGIYVMVCEPQAI